MNCGAVVLLPTAAAMRSPASSLADALLAGDEILRTHRRTKSSPAFFHSR
jgi:hypothetical protein